jgi:hypothetical protein
MGGVENRCNIKSSDTPAIVPTTEHHMADQMTQQQQLLPNVSIFVDNEASDALRCQLCERVAKNPYNTSCLHRFCKHCTDGVVKGVQT